MKALLYKDFYLERQQLYRGILLQVFFAVVGVIVLRGITVGNFNSIEYMSPMLLKYWIIQIGGTGIACALGMTKVFEYDDKSEWSKLQYALPIPTFTVVVSKYLLLILGHTCMNIITWISSPLLIWAAGGNFSVADVKTCITIWVFGLVLILLLLPFDILFPAKTAAMVRMSLSFGMVLILIFLLVIGIEMDEIIRVLVKDFRLLYSYAPICILVLTVASVGITAKLKEKRGYKI